MAEHKEDDKLIFTIDNFSWNPFLMTELSHKFFTERCLSYVIQNCNVRLLDTDIEDFQNSFALLDNELGSDCRCSQLLLGIKRTEEFTFLGLCQLEV